MQKHERETIRAIREVVEPAGLTVELCTRRSKNSHKQIIVRGPGDFLRSHTCSSSPRVDYAAVDHKRRWAMKIVKEFQQ